MRVLLIKYFYLLLFFGLISCSNKLKFGEYVHKYKGGHNSKIYVENDSVLRFQKNVSMLFMDTKGKYKKQGKILLYIPEYNSFCKCYDTLPFSKQKIKIKNKNTLEIDGIKFKYKH